MAVLRTLWFFLWRMTLRGLLLGLGLGLLYGGLLGFRSNLISASDASEIAGNTFILAVFGGGLGTLLGAFLGPVCGAILFALALLWHRFFYRRGASFGVISALVCASAPFVVDTLYVWRSGGFFFEPARLPILLTASLAAGWSAWSVARRYCRFGVR